MDFTKVIAGKRKAIIKMVVLIVIVACIILLNFQLRSNRNNAFNRLTMTLNQIEEDFENNYVDQVILYQSLSEEYCEKAVVAAHILSNNRIVNEDQLELMETAKLIGVEEINIFTTGGVLYAGTNPEYYGMTFDDPKFECFKPMLESRANVICQDMNADIYEADGRVYAMAWREDGTGMVQIGVSNNAFVKNADNSDISTIISKSADESGVVITVADAATGTIVGCTNDYYEGADYTAIGFPKRELHEGDDWFNVTNIDGKRSFIVMRTTGDYILAASLSVVKANPDLPWVTGFMFIVLMVTSLILLRFIHDISMKMCKFQAETSQEMERIKNSYYQTAANALMNQALNEANSYEGIKFILKELTHELDAKRALLFIDDRKRGIEEIMLEWNGLEADQSETNGYTLTLKSGYKKEQWPWGFEGRPEAVMFDRYDVRKISEDGYQTLLSMNINTVTVLSLNQGDECIGFISVADASVERVNAISGILQQISMFVVALLRDCNADDIK